MPHPESKAAQICAMNEGGMPNIRIAYALKCSRQYVGMVLSRYGRKSVTKRGRPTAP